MVATPLHYPLAYAVYKLAKGRLSLPALIVSSVTPDLEIPFMLIITDGERGRLILHSVFGASTIGLFLSFVITITIYPLAMAFLLRLKKSDVENIASVQSLFLSCWLGLILHILLDSLHHDYNPLFYPFSTLSFNGFVLFSDWMMASSILQTIFAGFLILIVGNEVRSGRGVLKRLFFD
ncbi:MAG: DUF4184 family protein [Nitrososphaeria archaeon]|nr:DUF4184 family protein [Nitrososphaeria archaeon]NIQ32289.1 DUF4184 family protein [Nitrososphaeria archaeon]